MNQQRQDKQQDGRLWAGLDWGETMHAVSIVDGQRNVVDSFSVGVGLSDLRDLAARLRQAGAVAGIAIEATCHPVVGYLVSEGFTVYPVNPKLSKNWRESNSVCGSKNDARDGLVLALELSRRHESLRVLSEMSPEAAELSGLCKQLRVLIEARTSFLQRLKALLKQYFPGVLDFFSDWSSPVAWRFIKKFSNPGRLSGARANTLVGFLKKNHIGMRPLWRERIERRVEAAQWPTPADAMPLEAAALAVVGQLQALQPHIAKLEKLIAERVKELPHASLMRSLPGAGDRLAPELTAMACPMLEEGEGHLQNMRCLSGVAPVEASSGKRRVVKKRRRCNKVWRNTLHQFAHSSRMHCRWAQAFYDLHREQGDGHASTLRKLADKWLKIIYRMLMNGETYDDKRYVEALRKKGSPIARKLCEYPCG